MLKPFARIAEFFGGTVDSPGRGKEVKGSFADSRNLLLSEPSNPESSLETAYGYSTTGGLAGLPTGFVAKNGTTISMVGQVAKTFAYSSEAPIAYDGRVYFFRDGQDPAVDHVVLDTWFKGSTSKVTTTSGFVMLDEYRELVGDAVTIGGGGTGVHTFTVATSTSTYKLSATADYYKGWMVNWYDFDGDGGTQYNHYAYIVAYSNPSDTATFTVLEDIGTGELNWGRKSTNDTFTFFRWFHNTQMHPTFDTPPGQCFAESGRVRGCGGASSNTNKAPWNVQYINRTWFKGCADAGDTMKHEKSTYSEAEALRTYQGTYADGMELSPHGFLKADTVTHDPSLDVLGSHSLRDYTSKNMKTEATFQVGWTLEYDGSQESMIWDSGTPELLTTSQYLAWTIRVCLATLSKRVTAINIYARRSVDVEPRSQYHFIRRVDLVNPATAELAMWKFNNSIFGFFEVDGSVEANTIAQLSDSDWMNRGGTYFARTGRIEEYADDRHIVSWKYAEIINKRLFVANFYDPNESQTFVNEVRFSSFGSSGAGQFDCIPYDRANNEFPVTPGSPDAIRGLAESNGWLVIFKDSSIQGKSISEYPETWIEYPISQRDGLSSPDSLCKLPNGILAFADNDAFKMLVNHRVVRLTDGWRSIYAALTKTGIVSWHDKIDNSLRFAVPTARYIYVIYWFMEGVPMFKLYLPSGDEQMFVTTERDGSVFFSNTSMNKSCKWHSTDYNFSGTSTVNIVPYFKGNVIIPDDTIEFLVDRIGIVKSGNANGGTLDNKLWIDDTQLLVSSANPWVSQDKTMKHLFQYVTPNATPHAGKAIQVEYNTNASGENYSAGKMKLHSISLYGKPMIPLDKST